MTLTAPRLREITSLLLPTALLAALSSAFLIETGVARLYGEPPQVLPVAAPATVVLPAATFGFRASGDFDRQGVAVAPPLQQLTRTQPLEIMTYEVTAADYARCVAAGACEPAHPRHYGPGDVPATGVNFNDATAYAGWLSDETGEAWRLPSVAEWDYAAAGLALDHGTEGIEGDPSHPWLADLDAPAEADGGSPNLRAAGGFGVNALRVADMGGNVWEWTADCNSRTRLQASGAVISRIESCGVRIIEGRHRMPMSAFVQDARGGGCIASTPPDNLGFRLVRDPTWYDGLPLPARRALHRL